MVILQGFLKKDSVARGINLDLLRTFQRETVVNDSSVDDEKDLLEIVKTHVDENKEPKVTISIDVADILAAQEAQEDWKKVKVGDKINIYLDELNVDVVAQIREINVNFEEHTLGFVISTVRNYNRGFGNFVLKTIRNLYNSNNNNVAYEIDGSRYSKTTSQNINEILQNGINTGDTTVTSGLQDDAGNSGTEINGSGTSSASIASVDDLTETVTAYVSPATQGVIVVDGKLLAYHNYTSPTAYSSEVEISADTGFTIRKIANGIITPQVYIDNNGNAVFAGNLSAGVAGQFDPAGSAATAQIAAQNYADGIESELQGQIDGAISTFFANGIPLPIITDYTGGTAPSNPQEGETWYNGSIYQIFTQGAWVIGGNDDIDTLTPWPTNDSEVQLPYTTLLEFYISKRGDLYYDNKTGYAYRFSQTGNLNPDVAGNYTWLQISDTAATASLAAAATKITVFTASDATSYNININSNIKDKDIFMPTGTDTALASLNTESLSSNFDFIKNDTYVYNESSKTFTKLQNVEEKDTGKVAGWEISAADIKAKNGVMILHSDSDAISTPGEQPYLSISQTLPGYEEVGIFLGRVLDGSNYFPKLSMVNTDQTNYLKWTGTQLDIRGTINATAGNFINEVTIGSGATLGKLVVGTDANINNKIIIEGGNTAGTTKIYSGIPAGQTTGQFNNADTAFYIDAQGRFSLGNKLAFTKDGGGSLSVTASIAGDISGITVGAIEISPAGITTTTNKFSVSATTGEINSTGGTIGGFNIKANSLENIAGTVGLSKGLTAVSPAGNPITIWSGTSSSRYGAFLVDNTGRLYAEDAVIGAMKTIKESSIPVGMETEQEQTSSTTGRKTIMNTKFFRSEFVNSAASETQSLTINHSELSFNSNLSFVNKFVIRHGYGSYGNFTAFLNSPMFITGTRDIYLPDKSGELAIAPPNAQLINQIYAPNTYGSFFNMDDSSGTYNYYRFRVNDGTGSTRTASDFFIRNSPGTEIPSYTSNIIRNTSISFGSNTMTVSSTSGLEVGVRIQRSGVPTGTTIIAITGGTSLLMSNTATASFGADATFEAFTYANRDYIWSNTSGSIFSNLITLRRRSFDNYISIQVNAGGSGAQYRIQVFGFTI
jgi:hypothetical protein